METISILNFMASYIYFVALQVLSGDGMNYQAYGDKKEYRKEFDLVNPCGF